MILVVEDQINFERGQTGALDLSSQREHPGIGQDTWKVLIVAHDVGFHEIIKSSLRGFKYNNKSVTVLSAYSSRQGKSVMAENPEVCLILLEIIGDKKQGDLEFINYVRQEMNNSLVKIIICTGEPEKLPEREVTFNYDINDYRVKNELTTEKIASIVLIALRSYKRETELSQKIGERQINLTQDWGEKFHESLHNCLTVQFEGLVCPALPQVIKKNDYYQQALDIYIKQDFASSEEEKKARLTFSRFLLDLLGNLQRKANPEKLVNRQINYNGDNWFSKLDQHQTELILRQKQSRLLILVSPPEISVDCPVSFHNNLKTEVRNGTGTLIRNYYPLSSPICPAEYYGDYFRQSISDADVKRLWEIFSGMATLILYGEITDYQVNLHVSFWTIQSDNVTTFCLPAWNWEQAYHQHRQQGDSEQDALRKIRQIIVTNYQLLAVFITDWYYLNLNLLYQPRLSQLASYFNKFLLSFFLPTLNSIFQYNQAELFYLRGVRLAAAENYAESLENFNQALHLTPNRQAIFGQRGQVFLSLNQWQDALKDFNQAIELNCQDYIAIKGKGIALFNLLRSEEALAFLEQALKIKPDDYQCWTYRGHAFYNLGRLEDAVKSYEKALEINPKFAEAINYRLSALGNLGIEVKEESPPAPAPGETPPMSTSHSASYWLKKGRYYFQKEKWVEALNCFNRGIKLDGHTYELLKWRGLALLNLNKWERALSNFDRALKLKKDDYRLWTYRGKTLYYLGKFDEAIDCYNQALSINPRYEKAIGYLQKARQKLGAIELKSGCGIDYSYLRDLLASQKWKEADLETTKLMSDVFQKLTIQVRHLKFKDIDKFPLSDLKTIDRLWTIYSRGHFGLSAQKEIYQKFAQSTSVFYDEKYWYVFTLRIGWRNGTRWLPYQELTFSLDAPKGHLPTGPEFTQRKMLVFLLLKLDEVPSDG